MKRTFITIFLFTTLIGIIAIALGAIYQSEVSSLIRSFDVNGLTFYKVDFWLYIDTIKKNIADPSELSLSLPNRNWIWTADITNWYDVLINNLSMLADYLIIVANILLYPIRVGAWVVRFVYTLMGLNAFDPNGGLSWLFNLINGAIGLQIPYI